MPRKSSMFLQFLTYGMLIGLSHGTPLIGKNVTDARSDEFLFVVSIARRAPNNDTNFVNRHFCTGTLISRKHVLTAAHCFLETTPRNVEIIASSANERLGHKYYPEMWITYNEWKHNNEVSDDLCHNDIGIITLKDEGVKDQKIHPIAISIPDLTDLYGSIVKIAGWGISENRRKPLVLKTGVVRVISNEECSARGTRLKQRKLVVPNNFFCSSEDPWLIVTPGDSGAPVVNRWNHVVGLTTGACPNIDAYPYSIEYKNENLANSHLHLYPYINFIRSVAK